MQDLRLTVHSLGLVDWVYLLNLDANTLEVFESQLGSCTLESEYNRRGRFALDRQGPPGYYCKLQLSELQAMWRQDWIEKHNMHAKAIRQLWQEVQKRAQETNTAGMPSFRYLYNMSFNNIPVDGSKRLVPRRRAKVPRGGGIGSE